MNQLRSLVSTIQINRLQMLQDSLIIELSQMLNLQIKPGSKKIFTSGGTNISNAYSYYLKGKGFLSNFDKIESIDESILFI